MSVADFASAGWPIGVAAASELEPLSFERPRFAGAFLVSAPESHRALTFGVDFDERHV